MHGYSALSRSGLVRVMEELPVGVVVLDERGHVVLYNRYEERLAGRKREEVLGRPFFEEVAPCMNVKDLAGYFFENIGRSPLQRTMEYSFDLRHVARPRDVSLRMYSFDQDGAAYGCLMVEDISARRAVEEMKESLSRFLVHDLKSPLTAVLSNLELLEDTPQCRQIPEVYESLTDAREASERLQRMVSSLLDIARLKTAEMPLMLERVGLGRVAAEAGLELRGVAQLTGRALELLPAAGNDELCIDRDLMRRAIENLIENGLRHAKTRVEVAVAEETDAVSILVEDDGPGIPEELRNGIFDPYVQGLESRATTRGRNRGLGLTFVQMAVRAHGGNVTIESGAGGGARFRASLPRSPGFQASV